MNYLEFYKSIKMLAEQYPYDECFSVNSFFVFDREGKLEGNAGMFYDDYLSGLFWARDWDNSGNDPECVKLEYAFVAVQHLATIPTLDGDKTCEEFYIVVADTIGCPTCSTDCIRTPYTIQMKTNQALTNIIRELYKFKRYHLPDSGQYIYTTPDRLALLNLPAGSYEIDRHLEFMIEQSSIKLVPWGADTPGLRGMATRIKICRPCPQDDAVWNISHKSPTGDDLAVTTCATC